MSGFNYKLLATFTYVDFDDAIDDISILFDMMSINLQRERHISG